MLIVCRKEFVFALWKWPALRVKTFFVKNIVDSRKSVTLKLTVGDNGYLGNGRKLNKKHLIILICNQLKDKLSFIHIVSSTDSSKFLGVVIKREFDSK